MKKTSRALNASMLIGQSLLLNVLSVPATMFIINKLGAYAYGQWALATSLVAAATFVANLGLRTLFVREVAQFPDQAERALAEQLSLRIVLAGVAGCIVLVAAVLLGYPKEVIVCVVIGSVGLGITAAASALSDVLQGFQQFRMYSFVNVASGLLLTITSVMVVYYGAGPIGLSLAYITGPSISLICFGHLVSKHQFPLKLQWDAKRNRERLRQSRSIAWFQLLTSVQDRIEQLIVPKLLGITTFGYFSAGSMPANRLTAFPDGVATAFFPIIARSSREDEKKAAGQVAQLLVLSLVICIPLTVLICFLAGPIASLVFPRSASVCRYVIEITIWSVPLLALSMPMYQCLQASGHHSEAARAGMVGAVLSTAVSLLLIAKFGLQGACWSWVFRTSIKVLVQTPLFLRTFPTVFPRLPLGRLCLCGGFMAGSLWMLTRAQTPSLLVLCAAALAALFSYTIAIFALRVIGLADLMQRIRGVEGAG